MNTKTIVSLVLALSITAMSLYLWRLKEPAVPTYLYKVLSIENWKTSQDKKSLVKLPEDKTFIHLAKKEQLKRITSKFWKHAPKHIILKLDRKKLAGKLVFEANPGGTNKYYHLYNGSIPWAAIVEAKTHKK